MSGSSSVDGANTSGQQSTPAAGTVCGACGRANPTHGQFCASCGHALYEPCPGCTKAVLLSQAFCGHCGCDLVGATETRRSEMDAKIAEAVKAAKERDFEHARTLLSRVTRESDFRFKEQIANANTAREKIDRIAAQETETASDRIRAAAEAHAHGEAARVVELLGGLAPKLLGSEAREMLEQSRTLLEQVEDAQRSLHDAFQKRDWPTAGVLLDRLLRLQPEDQSTAKLATKVGKKLIGKAGQLREGHRYKAAANLLDCVPENAQDASFHQLQDHIENVHWLSMQFSGEPFATPTLGRMAKQWMERSGGDPHASATLQRLSQRVKAEKHSARELYPPLEAKPQSWLGGPVGLLAYPQSVRPGDGVDIRVAPGQLSAAMGLALQGLGRGRIREDFKPKKGLLGRLGKKKVAGCWGLDLGTSGLKAVYLRAGEGDTPPQITKCFTHLYETPLGRSLTDSQTDETIRSAVQHFLQQQRVESEPVWVSFPARELVSRFVKLPPVADKQARQLFDKEIASRIPLPLDEVASVQWMAPLPEEELTTIGRPAFVSAAKQQFIERYLENLSLAGLEPAGLQATPIALANFACFEFADDLHFEPDQDDHNAPKLPSIALVDCGAETTTLLLVCSHSCWFWSFESGGEDFTRLIARATKTTRQEAENLKRNPALLKQPSLQYGQVEQKMEEMQGRLSKLIHDTLRAHPEFDVRQTWCCGGGGRTHGWIKRLLCIR